MKPTFDHLAQSSFLLWFDHELLSKGEAYRNVNSRLYKMPKTYDGHYVYSAPFAQWVNDSSIAGAVIPSGIYVDGTFIPRGTSGLKIDFENGRALFPVASGSGLGNLQNVSGQYALKDFNVYYTNEDEYQILFESRYEPTPKFAQTPTGLDTKMTYPAAFIKFNPNQNQPHSLGGIDSTEPEFRAVILCDSVYLLDGILSIFRDTNNKCFPVFDIDELPHTIFKDVKNGHYSWNDLIEGKGAATLLHIKSVKTQKFSERVNTDISRNTYGAIIDFQGMYVRTPRQ